MPTPRAFDENDRTPQEITGKTMRQVLKASQVQFEAPMRLGLDPSTGPIPGGSQAAAPPTATQARARIAESHAEYALVEVTCACGQTIHVRCDYEPAQA
jgi:hypothetical protein